MRRYGAGLATTVAAWILLTSAPPTAAQGLDGYISVLGDMLPSVALDAGERATVTELRVRVFAERRYDLGEHVRVTAAGFLEGLLADRAASKTSRAAVVRPQEVHLELHWARADLRAGLTRVVWGRLDEFLPTDVVNPQDLTRFFFEGRSEGRMAVGMLRTRFLPSDRFTLETIYVPFFRRGRFDQLDEATSPFNLTPRTVCADGVRPCVPVARTTDEPAHVFRNGQGGVRANLTTGRVDWSLSVYRGFESLPMYESTMRTPISTDETFGVTNVVERFPRFTMIGGDFETVRGLWGIRGELAAFVDRALQAIDRPITVEGHAVEAGLGVDRKAGAYRVSGNAVLTKRWTTVGAPLAVGRAIDRTDVTLVAAVDRSFARETRSVRAFAVYNPNEKSAFVRAIMSFVIRDNLSAEASGGWFAGSGSDALSRLASRDFMYARLKVFF